ncbi:MAG: polysaccharide deacetylase family protein, partial [Gemmatimonadaceae bacterium]
MSEHYVDEEDEAAPVFLDRSGRRWPRLRRGLTALGVVTTLVLFAFIVVVVFVPPLLPQFRPAAHSVTPRFVGTQQAHLRRAKREQLYAAVRVGRTARSLKTAAAALAREITGATTPGPKPIRAGFYISWQDNSLASLRRNYEDLDWVVCEWGFLNSAGDSAEIKPDTAFFGVYDSIPSHPKVLLMVNNFDSKTQRFNGLAVRRMLADPLRRTRVENEILTGVRRYRLGGVTLDFEEVPPSSVPDLVKFERELRRGLGSGGLLLTQTIGVNTAPRDIAQFAAATDYLFLMLYDEHYGKGTPGPIASQSWYEERARDMLRYVPPSKAILAIAAYGYDWNDAGPSSSGGAYTFQEVLAKGRDNPGSARMGFDRVSLNPYMTWTDPDSTDHLVWYLDGASGYNQVHTSRVLGTAGYAVWRLGAEDPAFWRTVSADNVRDAAAAFADIPPGYETEFIGNGEILQIVASPRSGTRIATVDTASGMIVGERIDAYPSPYIVRKYGDAGHKIAITFDDGPDGVWTPQILDTLKSRNATATFFVIGENVETHIPLMRRIVREGNLFGNHTFTHPNLALTPAWMTGLELDANQRLLEAVLDRRSFFFRPPYFGDAEPTTNDELVPVDIASRRGYVTVGLHIDAYDWEPISARQIVTNVMDQRYHGGALTGRTVGGNVILLHDGGGNRAQTVAALGPIIDSIRAHGDTVVSLSELAGIS